MTTDSRFPRAFRFSSRARLFALLFLNRHLRKFLFLPAVFFVLCGISAAASAQNTFTSCDDLTGAGLIADCKALLGLYDATDGGNWANNTEPWKQSDDLDNWHGVTVSNNRVTELNLWNNKLTGEIPDISSLTSLQRLDLSHNSLSGEIPPDLSTLTGLQYLDLGYNKLSGEIPDLSALTELRNLHLRENNQGGTIPGLSTLIELTQLNLSKNRLSGEIPDLNALTKLRNLYLDTNKLSGEIPDLSALTALRQLMVYDNKLSGDITRLTDSALTELWDVRLHNNRLSGTIPDLSARTKLETLSLRNNSLSGEVSAGHLPVSLSSLYLSNNNLSGTLPEFTDTNHNLSVLQDLWLHGNNLTGTITASNLPPSLQNLYLHRNSLSGTIPDLSSLTSLESLALSYNNLSGTIPSLSSLTGLGYLYLNDNNLNGMIASSTFPTSLNDLYLKNNRLSGTIPDLSGLASLQHLYLHSNSLDGEIPATLGNLTSLQHLYLNDNELSGSIPAEINNLTGLQHLYLHNNKLTGSGNTLGPNLDALSSLLELALWGNEDPTGDVTLTSPVTSSVIDRAALQVLHDTNGGLGWKTRTGWIISAALGTWHGVTTDGSGRVTALDLSGNGLTGEISNSLEALSGLTSLDLSNNKPLGGTLAERLKDISGLATLNIRCTAISTPSQDFGTNFTSFRSGCQSTTSTPIPPASVALPPTPSASAAPPPAPDPPTPVSPDGSVLIAETDDGFAFTPVGEGGRVIYGEETIDFTVTGNDDLSPNPTIILSRDVLDAIADAGGSVTFDVSADLSEDPPSGFRLGGLAADIDFGVELEAGETVGMCLPVDGGGVEGPVVYYYDEDSGIWEPLAEQETVELNGLRSVCGKTDASARLGLFVAEEDPPPTVEESGGGCAVARTESGSAIPPADLLSAGLLLLAAVSFRKCAPRRL